ncbi:MAG: ABC-type transport system ATP-binding protein II (probable substrates urea/short chain-amides) [Osedax symbiont Rs1]|nr:MAG: ABC-type transport system ATP-binding protein II (probable substrates urea/short chain-amides) [Osedax symbiont Rs1]
MNEIVLETHNLNMHFGGVKAVNNVDFTLRENELRCLIGPNGAGKSTFFKCLTGLNKPTSGEIYIRGEETTHWHTHQISRLGIGIKTQVPNVMDGLSVWENIWLSARRYHDVKQANRRVEEVIERIKIGDITKKLLGELAHGQRQRVELAIVLAADPWLVILDEPAAGMTGQDVEIMVDIIREINRSAAMIIVEHDMQFIQSIANQVTVFYQGSILMEDHVDNVLADQKVRDVYLGRNV